MGMIMSDLTLPRLYERDIDVLLQEELMFSEAVQALLTDALNLASPLKIKQCGLSVVDSNGETDLFAAYSCGARRGILLIENKIDAEFQPLQPERYKERAGRLAVEKGCDVICVLVAPARYIASANGQQIASFNAVISYEDVAVAIAKEDTPRGKHRSTLILRAIEQARRAYTLVPNTEVTSFWARVYGIASTEFSELKMTAPSEKGSKSSWIIFKAGLPPRITIDWKITDAAVDLSIWRGALPTPLNSKILSLPAGAKLEKRGTTEMIRMSLSVPPTNWIAMPDSQIKEALAISVKLLQFFNDNRTILTAADLKQ
jgi:hypothetical protein